MKYGNLADARVYEFRRQRGIASHGSGSVLKYMRVAHREGDLNEGILSYNALLATDAITDPSPPKLNTVSAFLLVRICLYTNNEQ